jgi:hypothetical protein
MLPVAALLVLLLPAAARAAGGVTATFADGFLDLSGDDAGNEIRIAPGTPADTLVVTGLEGTTVNGAAAVTASGVRRLRVITSAGDDRVEILRVDLPERLHVRLGGGRDLLLVETSRVRRRVRIVGSAGRDDVVLRAGSRFADRVIVTTGRDADAVTLTNASVGRGLRIDTGAARDSVVLQFSVVDDGAETLVQTGDGEDDVLLFGMEFEDDVVVDTGDDDDDLVVEDTDLHEDFRFDGGADFDELDFDGRVRVSRSSEGRIVDFEDVD